MKEKGVKGEILLIFSLKKAGIERTIWQLRWNPEVPVAKCCCCCRRIVCSAGREGSDLQVWGKPVKCWGTGIFSPVVSNAALRLRRMRMAQSTDRTTSLYTFRREHSVLCWYGLGYVGMFIYESWRRITFSKTSERNESLEISLHIKTVRYPAILS